MYEEILGSPLDDCMSEAAEATETIIITRAVNPEAIRYMVQGYPTKGLKVHAKSASMHPIGGMLPVDQRLCKNNLIGSPAQKATEEALSSIGKNNRKEGDLIQAYSLPDYYILSSDPNTTKLVTKNDLRLIYRHLPIEKSRPTSATSKDFFMQRNVVYPLWLLGVKGKPLIADIDLFAILFRRKHGWLKTEGSWKRTSTSHEQVGMNPRFGSQALTSGADYFGGVVEFEKKVIKTINECFGRQSNPIVHHGAELSNAHYRQKETANLPVGIYVCNGYRFQCDDKAEVKRILTALIGNQIDSWATFFQGAPYNSTIEPNWFTDYGLPTMTAEDMKFQERRHYEEAYETDPTEAELLGDKGKRKYTDQAPKLPSIHRRFY
jgi:hypothetical protein